MRTPDQPLIIASTVDQLGSRLLIQGYGVAPGMRPVHAGLAGNDILILLDEVHLSQPFKQTLERLGRLREPHAQNGLPRRFQFAFLSATPGDTKEPRFELSSRELEPDSPLGPRIWATKPARIVEVSGRDELATSVSNETRSLVGKHDVIAAVVNRVDTALGVYATLKMALGDGVDVVLLTGRMRPIERDDVLAAYRARIGAGVRTRSGGERKLIVVGTQCIEAGADFDFDAIVTESASFDGLRQRFGRVDRLGKYKDEKGNDKSEGVIVHDKDENDDPIYQKTIVETIKWLKKKLSRKIKTVDFGSRSLLDAPTELFAPKESAPTLLPAYLDLWSQTAPEPFAVPEPGLFLHGPRSGPQDVQIIWRADLDEPMLNEAAFDLRLLLNIIVAVGAARPSSLEAVSLPFVAARRWLVNEANVFEASADVEIKAADEQETNAGVRPILRWRGDQSEVVDPTSIRPGDTLLVPGSYGGIDPNSKCFDPGATEKVPDLAERASLLARGRPVLRLHQRVLAGLDLNLDGEDSNAARRQLSALANDLSGWKRLWAQRLGQGRKVCFVPGRTEDDDGWLVLFGERVQAHTLRAELECRPLSESLIEGGIEFTTDDEDSTYTEKEVTLEDHSRHVEERAREYAKRLGMSDELTNDLSLAAWLHDIGKADARFQRMLRGGSEIAYYRDEGMILAKSAMPPGGKAERQRAQRLSGYPQGTRHEVQSLAMIGASRDHVAAMAYDFDLVMHLVASHHGHCRPFAPATEDPDPATITLARHESKAVGTLSFGPITSAHGLERLDSPLADRFWSLIGRYGWLELCWLEAIVRLADHRSSEDEVEGQT